MVLMQEDKMIAGLVPEEGGGGHVIQNASGTAVAQEPTMQFADSHVSDDSTNEKTVIENIKSVTEAQFESATEDGLYDVDVEGAEIGEISEEYVEVEASGNKTWGQLLSELYTKIDTTKVNKDSIFVVENPYGNFVYYADCYNNEIWLCRTYLSGTPSVITYDRIRYSSSGTPSVLNAIGTNAPTDITSQNVDNGTKLTLYYGNDKAVVDLQTTANRCLMPDGTTTVSDALTYSTTAKKIGTFLGRNLYRKVFEYTEVNVPTNTDVKLTGSVGIVSSKIVRMSTVLRQSGRSAITNSPVLQTYITDSNEMWINQGMSSAYNSATITVIVEYTD